MNLIGNNHSIPPDSRHQLIYRVIQSEKWRELARKVKQQSEPHVFIICDLMDEFGRAMTSWDPMFNPHSEDQIWFFAIPQRVYNEKRGLSEHFFGKYSFAVVNGPTPLICNLEELPKSADDGNPDENAQYIGQPKSRRSHFDAFCRVVEKSYPQWERTLRNCPLFRFSDYDPACTSELTATEEARQYVADNFFLPFPEIIVEDDFGVCFIGDPDSKSQYSGLSVERSFLVFIPASDVPDGAFVIEGHGFPTLTMVGERPCWQLALHSTVDLVLKGSIVSEGIDLNDLNTKNLQLGLVAPGSRTNQEQLTAHILTTYEQIMLVNIPSRWVVEQRPKRERPVNAPHIPRSHERRTFTAMTVPQIHKLFGDPQREGSHAKKCSHPRRSHRRVFKSEVFTKKQGQEILIPATWIGPTDKKINGKTYVVRVDL